MSNPTARKRIAILTIHHAHDTRIYDKQANSLAKRYDTTLYSTNGPAPRPGAAGVVLLPKVKSRWLRVLVSGRALCNRAAQDKPDLIAVHDPEILPEAFRLASRLRIPLIWDCHENYPHVMLTKHWLPKPIRPFFKRRVEALCARAARDCARITTVTQGLKKYFEDLGAKDVVILRNYPVLANYAKDRPAGTPTEWDVIHVGTLSMMRGDLFADTIRETAKLRPGTKWLFLGASKVVGEHFQSVLPEDLRESVTVVPAVPPHEVVGYLHRSRVGINMLLDTPQFRVSIAVKLLEYLAAGLPAVSTPMVELDGDLPPATADDYGLFYAPFDPAGYAERLAMVLGKSDEELRRLGALGSTMVADHASWSSQEAKLFDAYERALAGP
ncbi:MAG: glycosyltransferase family 4 protein [Fimbriimonadaceae bacterium]|nr:glycosyltransferase family 4 protein [Fimbriimonadaceae bacterium]